MPLQELYYGCRQNGASACVVRTGQLTLNADMPFLEALARIQEIARSQYLDEELRKRRFDIGALLGSIQD